MARAWSHKWDAWWPCNYALAANAVWAVGYRESEDEMWKFQDALVAQADARYVELLWSPGCKHAAVADGERDAHAGNAAAAPPPTIAWVHLSDSQ